MKRRKSVLKILAVVQRQKTIKTFFLEFIPLMGFDQHFTLRTTVNSAVQNTVRVYVEAIAISIIDWEFLHNFPLLQEGSHKYKQIILSSLQRRLKAKNLQYQATKTLAKSRRRPI